MFTVPVLEGRHVRLEPLDDQHADGLQAAAAGDRSSYRYAPVPEPTMASVAQYLSRAAAESVAGHEVPFAQCRVSDGVVVGSTRYLDVRRWSWPTPSTTRPPSAAPDAVEIGSTWLTPSAQRTLINTEAKFLLLQFAFESWNVERVQIKTDAENERSRAAILRLGAHFEGVLRAYQPSMARPGEPRDTAMYAVTRSDWPAVRVRLQDLLAR